VMLPAPPEPVIATEISQEGVSFMAMKKSYVEKGQYTREGGALHVRNHAKP
jgi:hypothetical protein